MAGEHLLHAGEARDQAVDVVARGVDGERGARRGGDAEALHQHLRAVVPGAHAHALAPEDLGDVVRMDAVEAKEMTLPRRSRSGGPWSERPSTSRRRSSA